MCVRKLHRQIKFRFRRVDLLSKAALPRIVSHSRDQRSPRACNFFIAENLFLSQYVQFYFHDWDGNVWSSHENRTFSFLIISADSNSYKDDHTGRKSRKRKVFSWKVERESIRILFFFVLPTRDVTRSSKAEKIFRIRKMRKRKLSTSAPHVEYFRRVPISDRVALHFYAPVETKMITNDYIIRLQVHLRNTIVVI